MKTTKLLDKNIVHDSSQLFVSVTKTNTDSMELLDKQLVDNLDKTILENPPKELRSDKSFYYSVIPLNISSPEIDSSHSSVMNNKVDMNNIIPNHNAIEATHNLTLNNVSAVNLKADNYAKNVEESPDEHQSPIHSYFSSYLSSTPTRAQLLPEGRRFDDSYRLRTWLFKSYNKYIRPSKTIDDATVVQFRLSLINILELVRQKFNIYFKYGLSNLNNVLSEHFYYIK